jgi:hypothetical protein
MGNSRTGVFASGARMMLGISGTWGYLRRRVGGDAIDAPEHTHILSVSLRGVCPAIDKNGGSDRQPDGILSGTGDFRERDPPLMNSRRWISLSRAVRLTYTLDGTVQRSAVHSLKMPCLHASPERSSFLIPHSSFFIPHQQHQQPFFAVHRGPSIT